MEVKRYTKRRDEIQLVLKCLPAFSRAYFIWEYSCRSSVDRCFPPGAQLLNARELREEGVQKLEAVKTRATKRYWRLYERDGREGKRAY